MSASAFTPVIYEVNKYIVLAKQLHYCIHRVMGVYLCRVYVNKKANIFLCA